jgi:phosphoglucomutase
MVGGASVGDREHHKIYAESFLGADHLRRILEDAQTIVSHPLAASPQQPGIHSRQV